MAIIVPQKYNHRFKKKVMKIVWPKKAANRYYGKIGFMTLNKLSRFWISKEAWRKIHICIHNIKPSLYMKYTKTFMLI